VSGGRNFPAGEVQTGASIGRSVAVLGACGTCSHKPRRDAGGAGRNSKRATSRGPESSPTLRGSGGVQTERDSEMEKKRTDVQEQQMQVMHHRLDNAVAEHGIGGPTARPSSTLVIFEANHTAKTPPVCRVSSGNTGAGRRRALANISNSDWIYVFSVLVYLLLFVSAYYGGHGGLKRTPRGGQRVQGMIESWRRVLKKGLKVSSLKSSQAQFVSRVENLAEDLTKRLRGGQGRIARNTMGVHSAMKRRRTKNIHFYTTHTPEQPPLQQAESGRSETRDMWQNGDSTVVDAVGGRGATDYSEKEVLMAFNDKAAGQLVQLGGLTEETVERPERGDNGDGLCEDANLTQAQGKGQEQEHGEERETEQKEGVSLLNMAGASSETGVENCMNTSVHGGWGREWEE